MEKEEYIKILELFRDGSMSASEFSQHKMPEEVECIFDVSILGKEETVNLAISVIKGDAQVKISYNGRDGVDGSYSLFGHAEDLCVYIKRTRDNASETAS